MDIEIRTLKMIQCGGELKHFLAQRGTDFERRGSRIFIELANFVCGGVAVLTDYDLDKFRRARFENALIAELCVRRCRGSRKRSLRMYGEQTNRQNEQGNSQR